MHTTINGHLIETTNTLQVDDQEQYRIRVIAVLVDDQDPMTDKYRIAIMIENEPVITTITKVHVIDGITEMRNICEHIASTGRARMQWTNTTQTTYTEINPDQINLYRTQGWTITQ